MYIPWQFCFCPWFYTSAIFSYSCQQVSRAWIDLQACCMSFIPVNIYYWVKQVVILPHVPAPVTTLWTQECEVGMCMRVCSNVTYCQCCSTNNYLKVVSHGRHQCRRCKMTYERPPANLMEVCAKCMPALPAARASSVSLLLAQQLSCNFVEKERSGNTLFLSLRLSQKKIKMTSESTLGLTGLLTAGEIPNPVSPPNQNNSESTAGPHLASQCSCQC